MTTEEVAAEQQHLSTKQQNKLKEVLDKYTGVFDGQMGCYPHEEIHLELIDGAQPVFKKAYPVPFKREEVFKHELDNLVADGVLEKVYTPSAWALLTFIIPKKDETVCWVSDFCKLNKLLKQKPYPLPHIQDIMNKQGN